MTLAAVTVVTKWSIPRLLAQPAGARRHSISLDVLDPGRHPSTSREINAAFASFVSERPDALFVASSPFFLSRRLQLAHLATRYAIPAVYPFRDYADVGGLIGTERA
jgi:putative tryptophan/tyrosine transport system substrate-binding protein